MTNPVSKQRNSRDCPRRFWVLKVVVAGMGHPHCRYLWWRKWRPGTTCCGSGGSCASCCLSSFLIRPMAVPPPRTLPTSAWFEVSKGCRVFGAWSDTCFNCVHYTGTQTSGGLCRVWSAVITLNSPLMRQCPHWSCKDGTGAQGFVEMVGAG